MEYFDKYNLEQLNKIPPRFSNNLIWNIGHLIIIQQALIYKYSDLQGYFSKEFFEFLNLEQNLQERLHKKK